MIMKNRCYSDLIKYNSFEDRFRYLKLDGFIGIETFGGSRWLNQYFYSSKEWKTLRDEIIIRDNGMDLGLDGYPIRGAIYIHHMNPINEKDILAHDDLLINPEFLICVSRETHNAIHYGTSDLLVKDPIIRYKNDTCPWKQ